MKKIKTFAFVVFSFLLVFLVSCGNKTVKLATPTNLKVEEMVVTWDKVINAEKYNIDINGEKCESTKESCDFKDIQATKYNIKVQAVSSLDKYTDSNYSVVFVYEKTELEKLTTPVISLKYATLSWEAVLNAKSYEIVVNDETYSTTNLNFDLSEIVSNSYNIKVIAIGDDITYQNSDYSEEIIVTPENKVVIEEAEKLVIVASSVSPVQGFIIELSFDESYSLKESDIKVTDLIPKDWIYDIFVSEGKVVIAVTGLEPINLNFAQIIFTIDVSSVSQANIELVSGIIDN